jgi:hypothetical protein
MDFMLVVRNLIHYAVCILCVWGFVLGMGSNTPAQNYDFERGLRNYRAIMGGTKTLDQLSAEERLEVFMILQRLRSRNESSEDCKKAKDSARSTASELEGYAKKVMRCADGSNLTDDCSSEFRRTKSAHSGYESMVSRVKRECN